MSICSKSREIPSCSNSASDGSNRLHIYVVSCAKFSRIESLFCTLVELLYCNILIIKDLSMMYRTLCDGKHKGATGISQCTRPVAPSALTYPIGPWVRLIKQFRLRHHSKLSREILGACHVCMIRHVTVYPKKYAHGFVVLCFVRLCNRS